MTHEGGQSGAHVIRCKLNGRPLAMKLDGGQCACPSADKCVMVKSAKDWVLPRKDGHEQKHR